MNNFYINSTTAFHLEITKNYGNYVSSSDNDLWCNIILDVSNEYFKYNLATEGITVNETKKIRNILKNFLDENYQEEEFETLEPYLTIITEKAQDKWYLNIRFNLILDGSFSGDYYNICLSDKNDIEKLYKALEILN